MTSSDSKHSLPSPPPSLRRGPLWTFEPVYLALQLWREEKAQGLQNQDLDLPYSFNPKSNKYNLSSNLGDFNRLFQHLEWQIETSTSGTSTSTDGELSNHDSPPSSLSDKASRIKGKEVRWTDQIQLKDLHTPLRKSNRKSANQRKEVKNTADFESEAEDYLRPALAKPKLWTPPAIPVLRIDAQIIQPLDTLTYEEKMAKLDRKLNRLKKAGLSNEEGIHVFVDVSNIVIGFYNALKIKRGLNVKAYTKQAPISWQALAMILERGRVVARRILVGSNSQPIRGQSPKLPSYIVEAEACGYELNILERVLKHKDTTPRKRNGRGNGYATTSGHSSSDGGHMNLKVSEQGVDEILQMKLLESLVDTQEPATIVLASGDAAEAEYSGGFLKNVERALSKGWKVELVSWSQGLGQEYRSKPFLKKWKDSFDIIELDEFSEELLAVYSMRFATVPSTEAPRFGFYGM